MVAKAYKHHSNWLGVAIGILKNKEDGEDAVQQLYIDLHLKPAKVLNNGVLNKSHIYAILKNICLMKLRYDSRNKRKGIHVELEDHLQLQQDSETRSEKLNTIEKEVESWNSTDKALFELLFYTGLNTEQLANGTAKKARLISSSKKCNDKQVIKGLGIERKELLKSMKLYKKRLKEKLT